MKTQCVFCNYYKEKELSHAILEVLVEKDIPHEDYMLWMKRMIDKHGNHDYHAVKVHMGRMHKDNSYKYISPNIQFSDGERAIINRYE